MPRIPAHVIDQKAAARRIIPEGDDRGVRPGKPVCTEQILYDHRPVGKVIIMRQLHRKRQSGKHRCANVEKEMEQVRPLNTDLSTKQEHKKAGHACQSAHQEQIRRLRQHTRQCSQIKQQSDPGHTDYRNKPALYPYSSVQNEKIPAKRQQEHPCSSCINYSSQFPAPPVLFIRRSDIRSASFY